MIFHRRWAMRFGAAGAAWAALELLKAVGLRGMRRGVQILLLHHVPPRQYRAFGRFLDFVFRHFDVIDPGHAALFFDGRMKSNIRPSLLFSFDDGFSSNWHLARQFLNPLGIKAVFFVCPALIELPPDEQRRAIEERIFDGQEHRMAHEELALMDLRQLEDLMNSGHSIGSHTLRHARLPLLAEAQKTEEIVSSAQWLKRRLGRPADWFAYPFGDIGSIDGESLRLIGETYAYCCSGVRGRNDEGTNPLGLRRQSLDLETPGYYQKFILEGGFDFLYARPRRVLNDMSIRARKILVHGS
ncbi:MAG: polysaccharide deacetylase family protein [Elusimicrobia bacterium]|nr:polysaccharide deacetylase family protein [Elusimicrobiota bacterium]